jgi:tetratricopeptide (TPR) repeat protein
LAGPVSESPREASGRALPVPVWARQASAAATLFALSLALYARTLGYEFLNWDDTAYVLDNPFIRELSLRNLFAVFTRPVLESFFPLQATSYMLDYQLWELDPFGYHLTSLLLYACVPALAFLALRMLSRRPAIAFVAALLFAVHHTHVSSVAWVSGRKELLFAVFLLLSLCVYLRARRDAAFHWPLYALSVLCFGLGAAGKASIGTYPAFFLLADWVLDRRLTPERRRGPAFHLATKLPYVLAALPFVWMNSVVQATSTAAWAADPLSYALVQGQAAWRYLWLLLGLLPGQPIYDLPPISYQPVLLVATLLPFVVPPAVFLFALRRGYADVAQSIAWLALGLAPPMLFPVIHFMADRYLFVPSLGFCWLLAAGIVRIGERRTGQAQWVVIGGLSLLAAVGFARKAWEYTPVWRDSVSFWSYGSARSRDGRVAIGLASALLERDRLEEAEQVLLDAPVIGAKGELNLAIVYARQGRPGQALAAADRAQAILDSEGGQLETRHRVQRVRGEALWQLDRRPEAIEAWEEALRVKPGDPEVLDLLWSARPRPDLPRPSDSFDPYR